jgi:hypothetical protein
MGGSGMAAGMASGIGLAPAPQGLDAAAASGISPEVAAAA